MKKLLSLVMAGAMVASLVPATAFAAGEVTATAKVVDALKLTKDEAKNKPTINEANWATKVPELQLKVSGVDYRATDSANPELDVTLTLDNAEFLTSNTSKLEALARVEDEDGNAASNDAFTADVTGTDLYKASTGDVIDTGTLVLIPATTGYDAIEKKVAAGSTFDYSAAAGDVTVNGVVVYDKATTTKKFTDAQVAAMLVAGGVFAPDATVKLGAATITDANVAVDFTTNAVTEADQITAYEAAGYVLGKFSASKSITVSVDADDVSEDQVTFTFAGKFEKNDVIIFDLESLLTKTSEGAVATVSVDSKAVTADDLTYASVLGQGLKVSVKKTVDVAEDEVVTLDSHGLKIESAVSKFEPNTEITLRLSKGFEFVKNPSPSITGAIVDKIDDDEMTIKTGATATDELTLKNIKIEATSAKSGAVATITAKSSNVDSGSCEVAKVVDYKVNLTVDEDEDVPVIYSGTNVANTGLTDDSDHMSLEVTAEETFPGAWSMRQGFNFNLPDGVYVTKVDVTDTENFVYTVNNVKNDVDDTKWEEAFFDAYQNGDHKNFEFKKRVFDDVNQELETKPAKVTFQLQLVADPTFEGDVVVTFEGSLVDTQSVTIAKFVKPYTVKAEQNDVIIDYRNTAINTAITITEAAEGLLKENTEFTLLIEDNLIDFDGDPKVAADDASEMTIKDDDTTNGTFVFEIDDESDSAATITISDMELFMNRSIPAGGYDLKISTKMSKAYDAQVLFAPDNATTYADMAEAVTAANAAWVANARTSANTTVKDTYIDDVTDYSSTVKEAFINVVTSGRDQDNLFTTKVVVPVGEGYLVAGETKVTLDAPAYISAAGYTMLPVRAVSRALGVDTNNVLWSAETKTVTIMFAQRIISMTVGQKTIYVNGSAIPSSAAPEIKDGRTFLPLRDLGTALGVTNVSWDSATKTATLN